MNYLNIKPLLSVLLSSILFITGCAIGRKINYSFSPEIPFKGNLTVSVATWDQREAVVGKKRKPDFVGYCRSGVGIAYPIGTSSNKDLSEIITESICSSLSKKGFIVRPVIIDFNQQKDQIMDQLRQMNSERSILIQLNNWYTDSYSATTLYYDIIINIFDEERNLLAQKGVKGKESLGANIWDPKNKYKTAPEMLKTKLEMIFNQELVKECFNF